MLSHDLVSDSFGSAQFIRDVAALSILILVVVRRWMSASEPSRPVDSNRDF